MHGCGAIYESRVLSGPKSLKTHDLPSPAASNCQYLLRKGCNFRSPFVTRASILVGLILCMSLCGQLCCHTQQILFNKIPAMPTLWLLWYAYTSSKMISQAFQECSVENSLLGKLEKHGHERNRKEICKRAPSFLMSQASEKKRPAEGQTRGKIKKNGIPGCLIKFLTQSSLVDSVGRWQPASTKICFFCPHCLPSFLLPPPFPYLGLLPLSGSFACSIEWTQLIPTSPFYFSV